MCTHAVSKVCISCCILHPFPKMSLHFELSFVEDSTLYSDVSKSAWLGKLDSQNKRRDPWEIRNQPLLILYTRDTCNWISHTGLKHWDLLAIWIAYHMFYEFMQNMIYHGNFVEVAKMYILWNRDILWSAICQWW